MPKKFLLIIILFLSSMANAMDKTAIQELRRGQRPWNNTLAQDRVRITGYLKVLGVSAVALTGAALIEYLRMQSICRGETLR